ncbi:MAG: hypothetical protein R2932_35940 [Caldilineaceae bacterium]
MMQLVFCFLIDNLIPETSPSHEERRKRGFLVMFLLVITPGITFWTLASQLTDGMTTQVVLTAIGTVICVALLFTMRYLAHLQIAMRLAAGYLLGTLSILLAMGGAGGYAYFWFFLFPLLVYYLSGTREGFVWSALSWLVLLDLVVLNQGVIAYPAALSLRLLISYTIIWIVAHGLEWSRNYYYTQVAKEKEALAAALSQIKTLHSLLPICASCKKIRDDDGYWHQVENYIREHTGVEFTHGLCPDCLVTAYAEMQE